MLATASWIRSRRLEVGWALFSAANLAVMGALAGRDGGTVPFHFIWVSLTVLYGFTIWRLWPTAIVLAAVMLSTGGMIMLEVLSGPTRPDELTEVPLMAAMFVAMAWHAHRRVAAEQGMLESQERERDFLRESSHHLKSPIGIARGFAELVQSGGLTKEQSRDIDLLITELDRMKEIVEGFLVYTTTQSSTLNLREVDLAALLREVTDGWMVAAKRRWQVDVDQAGSVTADAERLRYAFDALLANAVEATKPASRITVTAHAGAAGTIVRIIDGGHGISSDAIGHVFDRFWTTGDTRSPKTGLGLAIVKSIVKAHGGSVRVESGATGTAFTIALGAPEPQRPESHSERLSERLAAAFLAQRTPVPSAEDALIDHD